MTDEELIKDAQTFANELMAKVAAERSAVLDSKDQGEAAAWAVTMVVELTRGIAISFMAAYEVPNPQVYTTFMRQLAMQATLYSAHPGIVAEAVNRARHAAAKIDEGSAVKQ